MERIVKPPSLPRQLPLGANVSKTYPELTRQDVEKSSLVREYQDSNSHVLPQAWKGKSVLSEDVEFMADAISFEVIGDAFEDIGASSFLGANHPPEPIDTHLTRPFCLPLGQDKGDGKCLIKGLSVKGPSLEDLSAKVPVKQTSLNLPRPCFVEKECTWDVSFSPSGNVSPHSSIDSFGVPTATSIGNSCTSTHKSDGMFSLERNYVSLEGSILGDSLESTKSSVSRESESSGLSDDSNWSNITGSGNKPHKGNDPRWKAILSIRSLDNVLGMSHFRLVRRLGCGDIGSVYLSELSGTQCLFAMKVMDKASLASRKKLTRAQTEREILQLLDHPFLPSLYTHFETDRFSCLVMEYCPGGDLHTLRQRQPGKHFSEYASRFYAAEVLLALEYLHMLGVVYRDLKPENVLVRDDGHIMLSDFDLSLRCSVSPTLMTVSTDPSKRGAYCVQPACIQPACLLPGIFSSKSRTKRKNSPAEHGKASGTLPELVAEPTTARSMSFVGTHEYLAPEIIKGEGHGSAVDWWTFGVFLHELLYGKTPFKGSGNRETLFNVVGQQLKFAESPATSYASRDLIRGLLVKEPENRLGVKRGATEIKQHPFFDGVNWALIRCSTPPEVPKPVKHDLAVKSERSVRGSGGGGGGGGGGRVVGTDMKSGGKFLDFEFF